MIGRDNDVRVILLGDSGVGKTSFVRRLPGCNRELDVPTLAPTYFSLCVRLPKVREQPIALWDTAGQERFKAMLPMYYRDANVVLLLYDISDRYSFKNAAHWLQQVRVHQPQILTVALIGNKTDLVGRQVTEEDGRRFAKQHKLLFWEISVLMGAPVTAKQILKAAVCDFLQRRDQLAAEKKDYVERSHAVTLSVSSERGACCAGFTSDQNNIY